MSTEVNEVEEELLDRRMEIMVSDAMHAWIKSASRHLGLKPSAFVRYCVAREMAKIYGPDWSGQKNA